MNFSVESITPNQAIEYLKKNTNNYRKLSVPKVLQYAQDMKAGRWELNGEAIMFDSNGILLNGQHRLAAIAKSGTAVKIAVIRDVSPDVTLYDIGSVRTAGQIVRANGYEAPDSVIGAANLYLNPLYNVSKAEAVRYALANKKELQRAYSTTKNGEKRIAEKSACILASYMMLRTQAMPFYELEIFFRVFSSNDTYGTDGYEPSSAIVARRMFDDRKGNCGRKNQREQLEICCLALQDFHDHRERQNNYTLKTPFLFEELRQKVRKEDGLE